MSAYGLVASGGMFCRCSLVKTDLKFSKLAFSRLSDTTSSLISKGATPTLSCLFLSHIGPKSFGHRRFTSFRVHAIDRSSGGPTSTYHVRESTFS